MALIAAYTAVAVVDVLAPWLVPVPGGCRVAVLDAVGVTEGWNPPEGVCVTRNPGPWYVRAMGRIAGTIVYVGHTYVVEPFGWPAMGTGCHGACLVAAYLLFPVSSLFAVPSLPSGSSVPEYALYPTAVTLLGIPPERLVVVSCLMPAGYDLAYEFASAGVRVYAAGEEDTDYSTARMYTVQAIHKLLHGTLSCSKPFLCIKPDDTTGARGEAGPG